MDRVEKEGVCGIDTRIVCLATSDQLLDPGKPPFHFLYLVFDGLTGCGPVVAFIKEQRNVPVTYDNTIKLLRKTTE